MHKSIKIYRLGETKVNKYGSKMKIVNYLVGSNILVGFDNGYTIKTTYNNFSRGNVANHYDRSVNGVGYLGEGKYKVFNNSIVQYSVWNSMINRCYDEKNRTRNPSYIGCTVCDEWHNYQTFAEWYDKNFYEVEKERMHLDKDILIKGNKVYSPDTCCFVPEKINTLFTKCNASRGDYPIGVHLYKSTNQYMAKINKNKKRIYLGLFNTPEEAFNVYKKSKEEYIKQLANEYKNKIPQKLYDALYKYKVEITD